MKSYPFIILWFVLLVSCNDATEEPLIENFNVSISSKVDALDIIEGGRTTSEEPITYTDAFYYLYDSTCSEVASEGTMLFGEALPPMVFPNLPAGKYFYSLEVRASEGLSFDTTASFVLESDTVLETVLTNKQFRFKFEDTSNFNDAEVDRINFSLNFSTIYIPSRNRCIDTLNWTPDEYDGAVEENSNYPYVTGFNYSYPIDIVSFQAKFYDENDFLLKSHIIPLSQAIEVHHSYTFKVDLASIWSGETEGNRINFSIEEVNWIEEIIQVN